METKSFDLKDFTKIEVGGAFEVNISQSDSYKVSVSADDFPHVRIEKVNDTLILKRQGIDWFAPFHSQPRAVVTLPVIMDLDVSGASHGKVENFKSDTDLNVSLSGSCHFEVQNISCANLKVKLTGASGFKGDINASKAMKLDISGASHMETANGSADNLNVKINGASGFIGNIKTVNDANLEISGASKVELTGVGTSVIAKVSGASKTDMSKYPVQNANVEISGASSSTINVNGKLDADVSGASKLLWLGTPVMGDIRTSGASQLSRK